ncbi:SHOCT domain-containing protein [Clostridium sp.]|jgi:putative membrane protein|uniref:SHOCT domain-containing protein n=1 Tax=Clostridium sp. TaxID=1506 RepID=UPI003EEB0717
MMGYGYGYNMMGGWFGMMIIPIILIGIIVYIGSRQEQNNAKYIETTDDSLNILSERFARGEINEDEYKSKKKYF